jgi:LmbE family N-acetylglucosaminyl deacetylase
MAGLGHRAGRPRPRRGRVGASQVVTLGTGALRSSLSRVLCLGAHADDIEIGCGGTILKLVEAHPGLHVDWVVFSADAARAAEAEASARMLLSGVHSANVCVEAFRESYFPYIGSEIKEYFDGLGATLAPDVVFTHSGADLHQDHRLLSELTWNTFRNQLILEYEIPKYDGDFGRPNVFVHLGRALSERKLDHLMEAFPSQREKHWFSRDTFLSTLRLRGIESGAPDGHAEAFYCRKLILA